MVLVSRDMKKKQKQGSSKHPEEPEMKKEESQSSATNLISKSDGAAQPLKRGQKVTQHQSGISVF